MINSLDNSTGDSVDGTLPTNSISSIKEFINLEAQNSDGNINFGTQISAASNSISTIDGNIVTKQAQEHQARAASSANVPQVIIVDSSERNSLLGKRPVDDSVTQNSLVNRFIITKNSNASQAFPIQVQTINASQTLQQGASLVTDSSGSVTKTITITPQRLSSPMKGITMTQIAGTPPKVPLNKIPISPAKTPTKITMIPVSGRSPQRIAPAGNSVLTNSSTSQATITMSPSKVIKQPGTVHVVRHFCFFQNYSPLCCSKISVHSRWLLPYLYLEEKL